MTLVRSTAVTIDCSLKGSDKQRCLCANLKAFIINIINVGRTYCRTRVSPNLNAFMLLKLTAE